MDDFNDYHYKWQRDLFFRREFLKRDFLWFICRLKIVVGNDRHGLLPWISQDTRLTYDSFC